MIATPTSGSVGPWARMRWLVSAGLVVLTLAACADSAAPVPGAATNRILVRIRTTGGTIELENLEVALTPESQARGLMGRASLPKDGGMAFLFDGQTRAAFWMKDTLIPLSILFWQGDGRIIDILDMSPCRADPCPVYRASAPYVGAIEMNRGAFERLGVEVGDTLDYRLVDE
jgi:uncharacterized membrane protein (UPF0127 family)